MPESTHVSSMDCAGLTLPFDKHRVSIAIFASYEGTGVQFSISGGAQVQMAPGAIYQPTVGIMSEIVFTPESEGTVVVS